MANITTPVGTLLDNTAGQIPLDAGANPHLEILEQLKQLNAQLDSAISEQRNLRRQLDIRGTNLDNLAQAIGLQSKKIFPQAQ